MISPFKYKFLGLALAALLAARAASGATEGTLSSASLSAPFENTQVSARSAGMGGALLDSAEDASGMLQNPAVLGEIKGGQMGLHHNSWIADIVQETVTLAVPLGAASGFGAEVNYVNYGHFDGRDDFGHPTSAIGASDLGLGLGYGRRLLPGLIAGLVFKTLQQTLADASYTTYSADFGVVIKAFKSIDLAAAYNGFGSSIGGSQRATVLRLGADWRLSGNQDWNCILGLAMSLRPLADSQVQVGGEIEVNRRFYLRCGYSVPLQDSELKGLQDLAVGAGVGISPIRLDYAYLPFGELGGVQRVSLSYDYAVQPAPLPAAVPTSTPLATASPVAALPVPALPQAAPLLPLTGSGPAQDNGLEFVIKVKGADLEGARELAGKGLYKEALLAYNQALSKAPEDPSAWRELAEIYFKLGKKDYALRCFEESLKLKPDADLRAWVEKYRLKME